MTNAEWMIENHMSFQNVKVKLDPNNVPMQNLDRTKTYIVTQIVYGDMILTDFESETTNSEWRRKFIEIFFKWLDDEHKKVLTDDERWILSESIKPYRSRVINIHKTRNGPNDSTKYISVYYKTTREDQPDAIRTDDAQVYEIKEGGGLQFSGMIPGVNYTIEELDLNE